jgi:hypothetical protein
MAETNRNSEPNAAEAGASCADVETLLDQVTKQLTAFEAMKLGDLKKELEQVRDKKKTATDEYVKEHKALREKWCAQQQLIERLLAALKCAFPGEKWKEILAACLCCRLADEKNLEQKVKKRLKCCRGPKERAWEEKKEAMEAAKKRLEVLIAISAKIKAQLGENDKLIDEVKLLVGGAGQAEALYVLIVKLLRTHVALRPDDVSEECKKFGEDDTVEKICEGVECENRYPDDSPCVEKSADSTETKARRAVPWIIAPDKLGEEINCAAEAYRNAKNEAAAAEAAYREKPDDTESLKKELTALRAKLEEDIRKCLRDRKTEDKCCTQPPAAEKPSPRAY